MTAVGISGHQAREGLDWSWVRSAVRTELVAVRGISRCVSSLAVGSDQVFADLALALGVPVLAVIPLSNYDDFFDGAALVEYRRLLGRCSVERLKGSATPEKAFLAAGRRVVDLTDILFAVWDGEPARGAGGTADIVDYARSRGRRVVHVDPIAQAIFRA